MPGPRPTPTALRVLKGERSPSRGIPTWEPEAEAGPVEPPAYLVGRARELWDAHAAERQRLGVLRPAYATHFAQWCESVAAWERAADLLRQTGPLVKGKEGQIVSNPAAREFARFAELSRRLGAEFGMTPAATAQIGRDLDGAHRSHSLSPARLLSG